MPPLEYALNILSNMEYVLMVQEALVQFEFMLEEKLSDNMLFGIIFPCVLCAVFTGNCFTSEVKANSL